MTAEGEELFGSKTPGANDISISSQWHNVRTTKQFDAAIQTTALAAPAIAAVQHPDQTEECTQTESAPNPIAHGSIANDIELAEFLSRALRLLEQEPVAGDCFNEYVAATRTTADGQHAHLAYGLHSPPSLLISRLDWNCSGHVLAVAHGRPDHTGWCHHAGRVSTWNLARKVSTEGPDRGLDLDACATTLTFHPTRPNLLAVGIFAGQIIIADIAANSDEDPIVARSPIDDLTHREPITSLEWVRDAVGNDYLLASIAADGRVLLWAPNQGMDRPISGIRLAPGPLYQGRGILPNRHGVLAGTAVAVSQAVDGAVVAGTAAGGLIRCHLLTPTQYHGLADSRAGALIWSAQAAALVRHSGALRRHVERAALLRGLRRVQPVDIWAARPSAADLYPEGAAFVYDTHVGPVHSVSFSRYHRHLFLSCAADGDFRVYHMLRSAPILTINVNGAALIDARWSYCRPAVAAVVDARGAAHVIDLVSNIHEPVLSLPMNQTRSAAVSVAFNRGDATFLACGDLDGNVALWSLSERIRQLQPNEIAFLDQWDIVSEEERKSVVRT